MKGTSILLDMFAGREAAAKLTDGQLGDLLIEADGPRPGSIYRAVADRPVKGQGGMFLRTPDGSAFLRQVKGLKPGQRLLVLVTGHAEPGKAIPVTTRLLFKSRYAIVTPDAPGINISRSIKDDDLRDEINVIAREALAQSPLPENAGLILRSSTADGDPDAIAEDIIAMSSLATQVLADVEGDADLLVEGPGPHRLAWQEWSEPASVDADQGCFASQGVDDMIDALSKPEVSLSGGGSMWIEPTRALVAVDINTGGDTSPAAGLKANLAALKEIPRQLRLRGLGGQILLDVAPCAKKERRQMESVLRAGLKRDSVETILAGWTQLGLMELQRKRERIPLTEILK